MQKLRSAQFAQILERGDERLQVMAIDRPHIIEAELFEHGRRGHHPLGVLFEAPRDLQDGGRNRQYIARKTPRGSVKTP